MKQTVLRKYARLIARVGANIQKGQEVLVFCGLDQPKFVELLVDECYKAGAGKVRVEFRYQPLHKLNVRHQTVTSLAKVEEWEKARLQHYVDTLPVRIFLDSDDPDGLKGINQGKMAKANRKRWPILKPYSDEMKNKYQWCIAALCIAEELGHRAETLSAVKVVAVDDGKRLVDDISGHHYGVIGTPGLLAAFGHHISGREIFELLEYILHGHAAAETLGIVYLLEVLFERMTDDENDLAESGADSIINRIIDNRLAAGAETVHLFERAVSGAHSGCQYKECGFHEFNINTIDANLLDIFLKS